MKKVLLCFILLPSVLFASEQVPAKYYDALITYCNEFGVPAHIMARLISYESGWDEWSVNKNRNGTTDYGLCQLNSGSLKDFYRWHNGGKKFDPLIWEDNLRIGIRHMKFLYNETGSWWSAIAAYNMGLAGFEQWCEGERKLPETTKNELNYIFK